MAEAEIPMVKDVWLDRASNMFTSYTTYFDSNYRVKIENSIRHFQSRHASGSKYNKASYQYRSRMFRPKTRTMVRSSEAAASEAFFSNMDFMSIEPMDPNNDMQKASADITREIISYRLQNTIPWFLTCIGAFQETQKVGVVVSYQDWEYQTREVNYIVEDEDGNEVDRLKTEEVIKDKPRIRLIPIENVRISPNADWIDPINTSPGLIILWPMYVRDVKARMSKDFSSKTPEKRWQELNDNELLAASKQRYDSIRQVRDNKRQDPTDESVGGIKEFDIAWVHENFVNIDGQDYHYYTLGTEYMLSQRPVPLDEFIFHGERPLVMGIGAIETHRVLPDGPVNIVSGLQKEINENVNQRMDNVSLVLNKRYIVRRGAAVDIRSLVRNVAASVTMADKLGGQDIEPLEFHDVTGSSYQEQDRLSADFDSVGGGFDTSSVTTNRKMNETVGGMQMMRSGANVMQGYGLKIFSETWLEKVIKQLIKLEQYYETDLVVLSIASQKAQLWLKYGISEATDELLNQDLTITVSAGGGSTDPMVRLERFLLGVDRFTQIAERQASLGQPLLDLKEVGNEIFARLGYKGGTRFMVDDESEESQQIMQMIEQMNQEIQQLQAALEDKDADRQLKLIETEVKEEGLDKRKEADIRANVAMKAMDLLNPVVGEKPRAA